MLEIGSTHQLTLTGISHQGMGIGRIEKVAVFVPQTLLGEVVEVEIIEVKKNMATGKLRTIIQPAPERIEAPCAQYELCGGCELQHCTYSYQLKAKQQIVQDAMNKLARIDVIVDATLGMDHPWQYRNKGIFHMDYRFGRVRMGFKQKSTVEVVSLEHCALFDSQVNQVAQYIQDAIYQSGRSRYIQKVMIRESDYNGEMMVVFVTKTPGWDMPELVEQLMAKYAKVVSVYQNLNTEPKIMLGKKFTLLKGEAFIIDHIGELKFQISPISFFQVNNAQANVLYQLVLDLANLQGYEEVVDAYCGIGTISLFLAQKARMVYGVESVGQAIQDAKVNAKLNKVENCQFVHAKTEDWLPKWMAKGKKVDVIVVDPPRKGCDEAVLDAIIKCQVEKVIYVSCNPSTLARDLKYLTTYGYQVDKVQPVDLFAQTWHVEVVVSICRKDI